MLACSECPSKTYFYFKGGGGQHWWSLPVVKDDTACSALCESSERCHAWIRPDDGKCHTLTLYSTTEVQRSCDKLPGAEHYGAIKEGAPVRSLKSIGKCGDPAPVQLPWSMCAECPDATFWRFGAGWDGHWLHLPQTGKNVASCRALCADSAGCHMWFFDKNQACVTLVLKKGDLYRTCDSGLFSVYHRGAVKHGAPIQSVSDRGACSGRAINGPIRLSKVDLNGKDGGTSTYSEHKGSYNGATSRYPYGVMEWEPNPPQMIYRVQSATPCCQDRWMSFYPACVHWGPHAGPAPHRPPSTPSRACPRSRHVCCPFDPEAPHLLYAPL